VEDPVTVVESLRVLPSAELHHLAGALRQVQLERALADDDHDAIIAQAFEAGFARDGLGVLPWVHGDLVVCPGGMVSTSRASHRCSFVSIDDVWVWESQLLVREDNRSAPGADRGFRAVALVALVDGIELDLVRGRAREGGHSVERVVSYEVRGGELVEVSRRDAAISGVR
jgi:hypothetical protein